MSAPTIARRAGTTSVSAPAIQIRGVTKDFGKGSQATRALYALDLDVAEREFLCIVGASGCGKSTLLNLIAGLDHPTGGSIDVGGRRVAFMFQDATLFPWLTVGANIDLALKLRGCPKHTRSARVDELLDLVHLNGKRNHRPHEMSGGMRQRTALARVLAQDAEIVLMDEPFAALDAMTRDSMHDELERIWREVGLTVVFITHNVREAVRLADRTILLTSSPGQVRAEYPIDLPRPRHLEDPDVAVLSGQLTAELKEEVAQHVR